MTALAKCSDGRDRRRAGSRDYLDDEQLTPNRVAHKRTPIEALELCYPDAAGNRTPVHVPEDLFVIGTMNIADRSLALVDLAFRRPLRFCHP